MCSRENGLQILVKNLHKEFEKDSVCIESVKSLMTNYQSVEDDWQCYLKFDRYRYTRNLVDEGNGKFNLMILCWGEGHGSPIHDHSNAHCFMKILKGTLCETRFAWPAEGDHHMYESSNTVMTLNGVYYMSDTLGLHRVENKMSHKTAVSLHLYSPPFNTCSIFNQSTCERSLSKVTFWSISAIKVKGESEEEVNQISYN